MRYQKVVKTDGVETSRYDYVYSEGSLILITFTDSTGSTTARFIYDSYGEPRGFILNNTAAYLYLKNAQGDITGIVNENGEVILTCSYDAWGRVIFGSTNMAHMTLAAKLSQINPFTYRGYCYDYDIGMYYLQSRYYDPELRRFINADKLDGLYSPKDTYLYADSVNVFAYCANSPVNMVDYSGEKEADNTGVYVSNAFVFVIVLLSCMDSVIKVGSDKLLYKEKDKKTHIYKNSKKGAILIDLEYCLSPKTLFADFLLAYYLILGDIVFDILTTVAVDKFDQYFYISHNEKYPNDTTKKRFFLFSDECVSNEIRHHCIAYWYSINKHKKTTLVSLFMRAYCLFSKSRVRAHCKVIDIVEQDVVKGTDRTFFDYFNGISIVYDYSIADPYWHTNGIRTYQNVRNDWKNKKLSTDTIIYEE